MSIFGGIIAARQLYGLIGTELAFAELVATALLAHRSRLALRPLPRAAVGLLGAAVAPFAVGGESDAPYWLYAYFVLIAGIGLFVDTLRRWAWVSVLALVLGYGGVWLVLVGTGSAGWAAFALTALPSRPSSSRRGGSRPTMPGRWSAKSCGTRAPGARPFRCFWRRGRWR